MMNNRRKWKISLEESVFFVYDKYIVPKEDVACTGTSIETKDLCGVFSGVRKLGGNKK